MSSAFSAGNVKGKRELDKSGVKKKSVISGVSETVEKCMFTSRMAFASYGVLIQAQCSTWTSELASDASHKSISSTSTSDEGQGNPNLRACSIFISQHAPAMYFTPG